MKLSRKITIYIICTLGATGLGVVLYGASGLKAVEVSYTGDGREHSDKYIPGMNSEERPPDYGLKVRTRSGWLLLGVHENQFIGDGTLVFEASEGIPIRHIREMQLYDDDPVEDDILERIPFAVGESVGTKYTFNALAGWSMDAGFAFLWETAFGKAILLGIGIGVAFIIICNLDIIDFS